MRVLHVIHTTNPAYGGPVESVAQLGSYLKGLGVEVEVVGGADPPHAKWAAGYVLPAIGAGPGLGRYGYSTRLIPWLREHGGQYDVWVINGIWQYHAHAAAKVARELHKPYLVYPHGMLDPWSRRAHPFKYLKKFAYWILTERATLRDAAYVCFTAVEEEALALQYFSVGKWRSRVIGAGVAQPPAVQISELNDFLNKHQELEGKRILLFLGRIHPKKGLDILIRAFANLARTDSTVHLLVVGEGEPALMTAMHELCAAMRVVNRVTFAGPLYGRAKWLAYAVAELFVLPSHQENFGIAVAEALAVGVPVCISSRVNIWREINDSGAGIICEDHDESVVAALSEWCRKSITERERFSQAALRCFLSKFHISIAANNLHSALRSAIEPATPLSAREQ
jgi:glycosyltransferase involved in cell wall biosynthesis